MRIRREELRATFEPVVCPTPKKKGATGIAYLFVMALAAALIVAGVLMRLQ